MKKCSSSQVAHRESKGRC